MPITVLTGTPGGGKTALMMERLLEESKRAERPLFAAGIDGLQHGLATVLEDPRQWNAKDAEGHYLVPNGAIIFIDEAWKWFGHLHDASRQPTPHYVLELAEHRHRGLILSGPRNRRSSYILLCVVSLVNILLLSVVLEHAGLMYGHGAN